MLARSGSRSLRRRGRASEPGSRGRGQAPAEYRRSLSPSKEPVPARRGGAPADRDWLRPYSGGACPFPRGSRDDAHEKRFTLAAEARSRFPSPDHGGGDRHRRSTAGASPRRKSHGREGPTRWGECSAASPRSRGGCGASPLKTQQAPAEYRRSQSPSDAAGASPRRKSHGREGPTRWGECPCGFAAGQRGLRRQPPDNTATGKYRDRRAVVRCAGSGSRTDRFRRCYGFASSRTSKRRVISARRSLSTPNCERIAMPRRFRTFPSSPGRAVSHWLMSGRTISRSSAT